MSASAEPLEQRERLGAARSRRAAARVRTDHHVLHHGERGEQREVLERARDPGPRDPVRREREQVVPVELDAPSVRLVEPADAVEQRRLASAVGPDERADLPLVDRER